MRKCKRMIASMFLAALPAAHGLAQVEARKVVAVIDGTQSSWSSTRRAINIYDITGVGDVGMTDLFDQTPLFSIWTGYEIPAAIPGQLGNFEEATTLTVNPVNGTIYFTAFDSGPEGTPDTVGDTQGDFDLYRIDYQEILNDFITNNRAAGTMYAPTLSSGGATNDPHPGHTGTTVFMDNAITKVGELGRVQTSDFHDYDIEFVNPEAMLVLEASDGTNDHQIRAWQRVPGSATFNSTTHEGGFNGNTTEAWESVNLGSLDMDGVGGISETDDFQLAVRDGVVGLWVSDRDGSTEFPPAGDELSFFEIDFNAGTATAKEFQVGASPYARSFTLDEDPTVDPSSNDGDLDFVFVDRDGNLVIVESDFADGGEPKIITREVLSYNAADSDANSQNEVAFGAWGIIPVPAATLDDGNGPGGDETIDTRFVSYDRGENRIYFLDADSGSLPGVVGDVYVFDLDTGTLVYEELDAANHFYEDHGNRVFTRGDTNGDGTVDASDIDSLFAVKASPDTAAQVAYGDSAQALILGALGEEWFDLTGDLALDATDAEDLVRGILGTEFGDANLDGAVSILDLNILGANFGAAGGWADGDFNGDGQVTVLDLNTLGTYFGFGSSSSLSFDEALVLTDLGGLVPEPGTLALLGLGGLGLLVRRRRRA